MSGAFQVKGKNAAALFTLKLHRGDGMTLLAMDWKTGQPPADFVGFAIEVKPPDDDKFHAVQNRISFRLPNGKIFKGKQSSRLAPIQMFRWVHFPYNAELPGDFVYRVTPVFMDTHDELSYGEFQQADIQLRRDTYPGVLNVTFTRGFVSSQAFVDEFAPDQDLSKLLPGEAKDGLTFVATHPRAEEAKSWMGFEARNAILEVLDLAIADTKAQVSVIAYDLSEPDMVSRLEKLGKRLRIIIDDSAEHGEVDSGETQAAKRLSDSAGATQVKRQHMLGLQHNKTIIVDAPNLKRVVCGSTNFSWRGFYVQSNNALVLKRKSAVVPFLQAFESYWTQAPEDFDNTPSAKWSDLGLPGINAKVAFSPHTASNALLKSIADDIGKTNSSLFYSLAFLYQTKGLIRDAIERATNSEEIFVFGISDKKVGGLDVLKDGPNPFPVFPAALAKDAPAPFSAEPAAGGGIRMHHKFVVIDFNKPSARVYLGSYNFSRAADLDNGENLLLIRNRRIAVSYMIEALRMIDHYSFRVSQKEAKKEPAAPEANTKEEKGMTLRKPARKPGEKAWWDRYYTEPRKIRDRKVFA
jgi:phosphatidylserine/phosphatidylglycerophosphate/cardiolipin synthase-like enzyme